MASDMAGRLRADYWLTYLFYVLLSQTAISANRVLFARCFKCQTIKPSQRFEGLLAEIPFPPSLTRLSELQQKVFSDSLRIQFGFSHMGAGSRRNLRQQETKKKRLRAQRDGESLIFMADMSRFSKTFCGLHT